MVCLDRHEVGLQNPQTHENTHDDGPSTRFVVESGEPQQSQRSQIGHDANTEKADSRLKRQKLPAGHRDLVIAPQQPTNAPSDIDQMQRDASHQGPHAQRDEANIINVDLDEEPDGFLVLIKSQEPQHVAGPRQHEKDRNPTKISADIIAGEEREHVHLHKVANL